MYELFCYMNIRFYRNVICHFGEFYFETNFGEFFRSWEKVRELWNNYFKLRVTIELC